MGLGVIELSLDGSGVKMQTTIFFQSSLPHILLLSGLHKCATFLMTPCIDRVKSSSSSLYIVMKMKSSVRARRMVMDLAMSSLKSLEQGCPGHNYREKV